MSEIIAKAVSAQRALFEQMNERALADIEWYEKGRLADGDTPERSDEGDSGEGDGSGI